MTIAEYIVHIIVSKAKLCKSADEFVNWLVQNYILQLQSNADRRAFEEIIQEAGYHPTDMVKMWNAMKKEQ